MACEPVEESPLTCSASDGSRRPFQSPSAGDVAGAARILHGFHERARGVTQKMASPPDQQAAYFQPAAVTTLPPWDYGFSMPLLQPRTRISSPGTTKHKKEFAADKDAHLCLKPLHCDTIPA